MGAMAPSNARGVRCMTCGAVYRAEFPRCVNDGTELVIAAPICTRWA